MDIRNFGFGIVAVGGTFLCRGTASRIGCPFFRVLARFCVEPVKIVQACQIVEGFVIRKIIETLIGEIVKATFASDGSAEKRS